MQGAREYADIFDNGQRGRLYLVSGAHARGRTFHIWVLPDGVTADRMPWCIKDAVEVYGITGGQPGWTETYGWLHRGKWEQDFEALVQKRRAEIDEYLAKQARLRGEAEAAEAQRKARLLASY